MQVKTQVVFIRHEDKLNILSKVFSHKGSDLNDDHGLRIKKVAIQPDSLYYSWGNARNGKLGISDNFTQDSVKSLPYFYIDDSLELMNDDLEAFRIEMGLSKE